MSNRDGIILCWNLNDVDCLKMTAPEMKKASERTRSDLLVIDGGSTDGSIEYLDAFGINYIVQAVPGMRNAYQTGFQYAFEKGYTFAVVSQSDGNCDFASTDKLFAPLRNKQADLVIGSRYSGWNRKSLDDSLVTAFGNLAFSLLYSIVSRKYIRDPLVGFRGINLFSLSYLDLLNNNLIYWKIEKPLRTSLGWCPLVTLEFCKRKLRIIEILIPEPKRTAGKPKRQTFRWGAGFLIWAFLVPFRK